MNKVTKLKIHALNFIKPYLFAYYFFIFKLMWTLRLLIWSKNGLSRLLIWHLFLNRKYHLLNGSFYLCFIVITCRKSQVRTFHVEQFFLWTGFCVGRRMRIEGSSVVFYIQIYPFTVIHLPKHFDLDNTFVFIGPVVFIIPKRIINLRF